MAHKMLILQKLLCTWRFCAIFPPLMDSDIDNSPLPMEIRRPEGMARREFLRTATFAGAALMLGVSSNANAFWFLTPKTAKQDLMAELQIPMEWQERLGVALPDYVQFLHRLRLKNISVKAILEPQLKKRGSVANSLPPREIWKNMAPTLRAVDKLSTVLEEPLLEVVSAYRSPAYNRSCGSMASSQHVRNSAVDLRFSCSPRVVSKVARELRDKGLFMGGVGRYRGFTHIDTRGKNADW